MDPVPNRFDVIVVGLGIMGASALYQCALRRGAKILGLDQFIPPHSHGSSHGETRITRQAIGEGEIYMPFIQRSNQIWRQLQQQQQQQHSSLSFSEEQDVVDTQQQQLSLYVPSGGLIIAPTGGSGGATFHAAHDFVSRTAHIAQVHGISHEIWDAQQTMKQYPKLKMRPQDRAYFEPEAGLLRAELCVKTQLQQAKKCCANIHVQEVVTHYLATTEQVVVTTNKAQYQAEKIILAAGPWLPGLLKHQYRPNLQIYRQVICWFEADETNAFTENNFPFLIWIGDTMDDFFAAFPIIKDGIQGVKVMTEQYTQTTNTETIDRHVHPHEIDHLFHMAQQRLHGLRKNLLHADVCMYTVTPDEHFILDFHPDSQRVIIASPCSGHGFKHSAAIGEALTQLALDGKSELDISSFRWDRFGSYM